MISFGSVCSGIEAASVAWHPLGWRAAWLSEVDKAASQVLAHRFPSVPNLGDMTLLAEKVRRREVAAPDLLVGGTPCQAFSVAGLRGGLSDPRGQLTLAYVLLANAIDEVRAEDGLPPCIIVWENVPGVLNHKDNPFGCFLGGIAGETVPLVASGKRWTNAGVVCGPQRAAAWRVLDAQFFGLAQRRRRVFVVASAREGFDPGAILLEFDGMRRDSAPSREAGEGVAGTLDARAAGGGFPGSDGAFDGHVQPVGVRSANAGGVAAYGGNNQAGPIDVATAYNAHGGPHGRLDFESETFVLSPIEVLPFDTTQVTSPSNYSCPQAGDPCHPLAAGAHAPAVAYSVSLRGREGGGTAELGDDLAGCLRASSGGGDKPHVLAPVCVTGDITHTLKAEGFDASEDGTGRGQPIVPAYSIARDAIDRTGEASDGSAANRSGLGIDVDVAATVKAKGPGAVASEMAVRRLMPVECERLQGFPDDWTLVPTGKRLAADGPRYKQCGNSMAVTCMAWIGRRIAAALGSNGGPPLDQFEALL